MSIKASQITPTPQPGKQFEALSPALKLALGDYEAQERQRAILNAGDAR